MIFLSSNYASGAEIKDVNGEKTPLLETKSVRAAPKQSPGEAEVYSSSSMTADSYHVHKL